MAISFVPNDPRATAQMPLRRQKPRLDRPAARAGFSLPPGAAEAPYAVGSPNFLWWQCREAALAAVDMWELVTGSPITKWARLAKGKSLALRIDEGRELNAYYDGTSLLFFHHAVGSGTMWTGASTDVVSHECGHAMLDVIRPDLFDANFVEAAAFHEAFGDCVALLTALSDRPTRKKLLELAPKLDKANFVEALMEDLANGFRVNEGKDFSASAPRKCLNKFQWALPESLDPAAPPAVLTREEHSFGRLFAGSFYDLIRLLFQRGGSGTEAGLWKAAALAGRLLVEGTKVAPVTPRFFQAVGRAMAQADANLNAGKYTSLVGKAFALHNIEVFAGGLGAPKAALKGASPKRVSANTLSLSRETMQDLQARFGAASPAAMQGTTVKLGSQMVRSVVHSRQVDLGMLSDKLKGVVAVGLETTMVGSSNHRAALVSTFPDATITSDEVRAFVETLLANDRINLGAPAMKGVAAAKPGDRPLGTHRVRKQGDTEILERVRFSCGCPSRPQLATQRRTACAEE